MNRLFELLAARGWKVVVHPEPALRLPADVTSRYPRLPDEVKGFLGQIECCLNPQEDAWLLGAPDYVKTPDVAFPWDAIEQLALESCDSAAERAEQASFWDNHFPIAISVRADDDNLAVCLSADAFGSVVHGYAPVASRRPCRQRRRLSASCEKRQTPSAVSDRILPSPSDP